MEDPTITLVRDDYWELPQYTGVKPLDVLAKELGYAVEDLVKLDANENPFGPITEIKEALKDTSVLHIYPDPLQTNFRRHLRNFLNKYTPRDVNVTSNNIICGTGSDELLEIILKLVQPEEVINCQPTFGMYDFLAKIAKAKVITVPRINYPFFDIDMDKLKSVLDTKKRQVIYLASPNNPTGGTLSLEEIKILCEVSKFTTVVIDQAYAEFDFEASNKVISLLTSYPNLIVMRTFSKWAGLAGARVGYIVAHEMFIQKVISIKQPYNVTVPSEILATAALTHADKIFGTQIQKLKEEKARMILLLQEFDWLNAIPSKSNFVLFKVEEHISAFKVYTQLRVLGVLIRYYSKGILKDYIRISVGRREDTNRLILAIREVVKRGLVQNSVGNEKEVFYDGIIFDMDGVLAEVSQSYRRAIEETCAFFDCKITQSDITREKVKGNSNNDWVLTKRLIDSKITSGAPSLERVTEKFQELYLGGLRDLEELIPSRSLLVEMRKRCKLGFSIVTGRPRDECIYFLEKYNLTGLFTSVEGDILCVCMNETAPKPSPEPVQRALKLMNVVQPNRIVMLGDTPDDIVAAKAAGVDGIGVMLPNSSTKDNLVTKLIKVGAKKVVLPGFVAILDNLKPCHFDFIPSQGQLHLTPKNDVKFMSGRIATVKRLTKETAIECTLNLDGSGKSSISTGIGFLDHMLTSFAKHSLIDLEVTCKGDLWIDDHHTTEDVGITLGEAMDKALGERKGIKRWGYALCPLDESLCRATVDISSRPYAHIDLLFRREKIGNISTEMLTHFLESFSTSARLTVHVDVLKGENDHHKAESSFKALAVALKMAITQDELVGIPSTKNFLSSRL